MKIHEILLLHDKYTILWFIDKIFDIACPECGHLSFLTDAHGLIS
jgi:hypothetical protein